MAPLALSGEGVPWPLAAEAGAVAGMVGGIGLGVCADRVRSRAGRRKALLVGACALAALCFAAFARKSVGIF